VSDPVRHALRRHFFRSLFDFGFLSDAGAESFKRLLMGIAAVGLGLGLLLLRAFAAKYISLADGDAFAYQRALLPDHAFLMALPMWITAAAVVCVSHSLFPDETDFRILMAQPVTRFVVFAAKLGALGLFVGLFVAGAHVALFPLVGMTIYSPHTGTGLGWGGIAYGVSSLAGCVFAVLAIVSVHGVIVLLAPRAQVVRFSTLVRSVMLGWLVLVLPLILRLPGSAKAFESRASWLAWTPPAWFVGLERWLIGDTRHAALAGLAVIATMAASAVAAASYAQLYKRFDRTTVRAAPKLTPSRRAPSGVASRMHPVWQAVATFTGITMRRSVLHQGIVVALAATAAGFVVNDLYVQLTRPLERRGRMDTATWTVVWAPFALMLISSVAVRLALTVPLELRANWIFRLSEEASTRRHAIAAAVWSVFLLGAVVPLLLVFPLQFYIVGSRAGIALAIELAAGWLLTEFLMREWRRIPFTCGYVPGKGFVPQMFVKGLFGFTAFTSLGTALVYGALSEPPIRLLAILLTSGPAVFLLVRRRRSSRITPFAFEDELPTEVSPLRLNID
jgi:hypothetical protein